MIILPDKNIPRSKFLIPVNRKNWCSPSQSVKLDRAKNPTIQTKFKIRARLNDGHVVWTGWFEDREDFDAFLYSLISCTLIHEKELWDLPTPAWAPGFSENITYDFATVTFISATGSGTYNKPIDWNNIFNTIETIGGGGASYYGGTGAKGGSGGGGYAKAVNVTLSTTASYTVGAGGKSAGASGGDTWFNGASLGVSSVGSKGGLAPTTLSQNVLGGAASSAVGGIGGGTLNPGSPYAYSGGAGGSYSSGQWGFGGGGGAAGPGGNGSAGGAGYYNSTHSAGGGGGGSGGFFSSAGGNASLDFGGNGGTGGTGGGGGLGGQNTTGLYVGAPGTNGGGGGGSHYNATASQTAVGGNGTEWDSTHGAGGGSGGSAGPSSNGANGGLYGGGAGACSSTATIGGYGGDGIIVITYTPKAAFSFNSPMLGM